MIDQSTQIFREDETRILSNFQPSAEINILYLDNTPILSEGGLLGIVADIGIGKSHLCEYIASLWTTNILIPSKFRVNNSNKYPITYFDTERPNKDIYEGIKRIKQHGELTESEYNQYVFYHKLIEMDSPTNKLQRMIYWIEKYQHKLVIVDGILDLLNNSNDIEESTQLGHKLVALANKYNFGLIYTIHSNRGDKSSKGKGHAGDVFQRKSGTFLKLSKSKKYPNFRNLTANFTNGKVRNGSLELETNFQWHNQKLCFTENTTLHIATSDKKVLSEEQNFKTILSQKPLNYTDLIKEYMFNYNVSKRTVIRHIHIAIEKGIIKKDNKLYAL